MSESHSSVETPELTRSGIRDNVLVLPSVICSHVVAEEIADAVEGCVATPHDHGCAQIGRDNDRTEQTLIAMGAHPNVAGCVVVGLGCEHVQSDDVASALEELDVPVRELSIQGIGGTDACFERGSEYARELRANSSTHVAGATPDLGDLTVGIVSTDLSEPTLETADPLVGEFADRVLEASGRVVVTGTERVAAHPEEASARVLEHERTDLEELLDLEGRGPARAPRVRQGASECTFEEVTRAWGEAPIDELLAYGDTVSADSKLTLVDASSRFEEAATALVAAGCHLVVHVTGDGIPTGHPIAPVVKVSATSSTLEAVGADIDVDAREATVEDLVEYVRAVAEGAPSRAEEHGVTSFAIERAGPSL